jgi:hypothetical protein
MPGCAKSKLKKSLITRRAHDDLMSRAVIAYNLELKKPYHQQRGLCRVCLDYEKLNYEATGTYIKLSHATLCRLADGGRTSSEAQADWAWLTDAKTDVIINFIIEMADRGFPLSHHRLKEHVDMLCHSHLGDAFPEKGVGINWTYKFAMKHHDHLKLSDSRPLEDKHGRAINPHTNKAWFDLLEETIHKYDIQPEDTYGTDEVGIQSHGTERKRVFGARRQGAQYQQCGGTHENTTVLVTICAEGTSLPPLVIYKGSAFQVKWAQNNPLNAS